MSSLTAQTGLAAPSSPVATRSAAIIPGLDWLRVFAMFVVVMHHHPLSPLIPVLRSTLHSTWLFMDLFFVMSGYMITRRFLHPYLQTGTEPSLRRFFIRRLFRIQPLYLAALVLYSVFSPHGRIVPVWQLLLLVQNYGLDPEGFYPVSWSLCVEEHFYWILPLLTIALIRFRKTRLTPWILGGLVIAGAFWRWSAWHSIPFTPGMDESARLAMQWKQIYVPTHLRLDGILMGVALALIQGAAPRIWNWGLERAVRVFWAGMALAFSAVYLCPDRSSLISSVLAFPLSSLGFALIVWAATRPGLAPFKYSSRLLTYLSNLTYAVYLVHFLVLDLMEPALLRAGAAIGAFPAFLLSIPLVLLAGAILHHAIERPFLRLRDRYC